MSENTNTESTPLSGEAVNQVQEVTQSTAPKPQRQGVPINNPVTSGIHWFVGTPWSTDPNER